MSDGGAGHTTSDTAYLTLLDRLAAQSQRIAVLETQHQSFVTLMDERTEHQKEALRIQREEHARRLDDLNDTHDEEREARADYVGREVFDNSVREYREAHEVVTAAMSERVTKDTYEKDQIITDSFRNMVTEFIVETRGKIQAGVRMVAVGMPAIGLLIVLLTFFLNYVIPK